MAKAAKKTADSAKAAETKRTSKKPAKLPEALVAKIEKIKELLVGEAENEVDQRYKIGQVVLELRDDPKKYGKTAVAKAGKLLKCGGKTLYGYCRVAETWDGPTFKRLSARKNKDGLPLSWSHFKAVVEIEGRKRDEFLEKAISEGLTSRELVKATAKPKPAESLAALAVTLGNSASAFHDRQAKLEKALASSNALDAPTRTSLERARGLVETLQKALAALTHKLDGKLKGS